MAAACGSLQQIFEAPFKPRLFDKKNEAGSFCLMNSESLQMCTEGLGFESLDGVEDLKEDAAMMEVSNAPRSENYYKREKSCVRSFPPPISSLGETGKPSVCFKSYRRDGRFVLQQVRIQKQEYLHASREDGRLRLSFVESEDEDDDDEEGDEIHEEVDDG